MSARSNQNRRQARCELSLPATSANLGPAFDAAALALKLFLKVRAQAANEFSVAACGRDSEICSRIEEHLILKTYQEVLCAEGKPVQPLSLQLDNQIPIGKGCGSSAAARLAGIALAVHFGHLRWTDARIIGEAARREHHPDNAAACWMGGLAVARMANETDAVFTCLKPKGNWPLLLAVPGESLSTEQARRILPDGYSRADSVANVQNSMLLVSALTQGRGDLLAFALEDRLHQPYRAPLCPLLPALQKLVGTDSILGVALSGAGPSVLIFLASNSVLRNVTSRVAVHLGREGVAAELIPTAIADSGAHSLTRARIKAHQHRG